MLYCCRVTAVQAFCIHVPVTLAGSRIQLSYSHCTRAYVSWHGFEAEANSLSGPLEQNLLLYRKM